MKLLGRLVLPSLLFAATSTSFASAGNNNPFNDNLNDLTTYLLNLGGYMGYNLATSPTSNTGGQGSSNTQVSQNFLNLPAMQVVENYLFNSYLGALLVNTAAQGATQFVPSTIQAYSAINSFANYTFTTPPFSSPSPDQVSVSTLIDQPPYQADPVSQAISNILTTPSYTYCLNNDATAIATCTYPQGVMNEHLVMTNVIGTIPSTQNFFTYTQIQPLLSQLNTNSLVTPLMYSTTSSSSTSTSSGSGNSTTSPGLVAQSQAQQALNFIRYATGAVAPMQMPNRNDYDNLYIKAQNLSGSINQLEQQKAQATLATYLTNLRIFAAQSSVGISNLHYILSKRLPQNQSTNSSGQQTSQALSEFTMATWRLYNPDQTANTQWLNQINNASSATVQKEMAGLLAEINYQLYLSRQQQERILLTNTMLLIQNARASQPSTTLGTPTAQSLSTQ